MRVCLTAGTFNIVHAGHIELFEFCKTFSDYLIVGINSDEYLKNKYKEKAIGLNNRVKVLKSIKYIDKVIVFSENTPCNLIKKVNPDVYVKGPDYLNKEIKELKVLKELNIEYMVPRVNKILSTSSILI